MKKENPGQKRYVRKIPISGFASADKKSDKKAESGAVKFILLKKIGKAVIDTSVTDKEIMDAVNEINYTEESAYE